VSYVNLAVFSKKLPGFLSMLKSAGAEVLQTTNEWEVLRFRTGTGVSIVYRNAKGNLNFTGESQAAWNAYSTQASWKPKLPTDTGRRDSRVKKASPVIRTVRERDGDLCFFCRKEVSDTDASLEHLVPLGHGGPSHLSNFFLAHRVCNSRAGHLSAVEKIKLHVSEELKVAERWWKHDSAR
jgi:hypothetical protein